MSVDPDGTPPVDSPQHTERTARLRPESSPQGGGTGSFSRPSAMIEVRCDAPSTRPRFTGERCNTFLGVLPFAVKPVGVVPQSSQATPGNLALRCSRCHRLHEYAPLAGATAA